MNSKMKHLTVYRAWEMSSNKQIALIQMTTVTAFSTNCCELSGINEAILPASPPDIKVKSAGMIGSLRNCIFMLFATPKAVIALFRKRSVAVQKSCLVTKNECEGKQRPSPTKSNPKEDFCSMPHIELNKLVAIHCWRYSDFGCLIETQAGTHIVLVRIHAL
ncbi:MAG: hypothetical protein ACLT3W_05940 [Bifidobacterium pseudocatenulatum]